MGQRDRGHSGGFAPDSGLLLQLGTSSFHARIGASHGLTLALHHVEPQGVRRLAIPSTSRGQPLLLLELSQRRASLGSDDAVDISIVKAMLLQVALHLFDIVGAHGSEPRAALLDTLGLLLLLVLARLLLRSEERRVGKRCRAGW